MSKNTRRITLDDMPAGYDVARRNEHLFLPISVIDALKAEAEAAYEADEAAEKERADAKKTAADIADAINTCSNASSEGVAMEKAKAEKALAALMTEGDDYGMEKPLVVKTFDPAQVAVALKTLEEEDNSEGVARRLTPILKAAKSNLGLRTLISQSLQSITDNLKQLAADMPNFTETVDILCAELALAMAGNPDDFRVTCLCLDGEPGIGKTRFAAEVARLLDVGFEQISLGSAQGGFDLAGSSRGWGNTRPGRLVRLMAEGKAACPIVLLDEIDKLGGDLRFSPETVLLDLLEKDTATRFRDESLELRFDASRIIFIATCNDQSRISAPLLSRMRIVTVPTPSAEQRRSIVGRIALNFKNVGVNFSPPVLDAMAALDLDLRSLSQFVRELAGKAIVTGESEAKLEHVPDFGKFGNHPQKMGFV